jgi:hypothetical protein
MTFTIITKKRGDFTVEIDDEDWPRVRGRQWQPLNGSVRSCDRDQIYGNPTTCLQCFILQDTKISDDETIAFRDGNILNNKKENFRVCTQAESEGKELSRKNTTLRFAAVAWCMARRKFCSRAMLNND